MGLSLLLSAFIHINTAHLLTNLAFFLPIAMMVERQRSGLFLAGAWFFIHFLVLLTLTGIAVLFPLGGNSFLGSSHIIVGLYGFWSLERKKYGLLFFALLIISAGLWENQSPFTLVAHFLGLLGGLLLFAIGHLRNKSRLKSAN